MNMNIQSNDFGFGGDEFKGEITIVPYAQFLNSGDPNYGIAITSTNAELAQFELVEGWQPIEHQFADGTSETLLVTQNPRLLVINRSQPLMSNETETIPYNKVKYPEGDYKAFSYVVVWFLDENNQPISQLPFRLKCSGYSGLTFLQNYQYYNISDSFCKQFLSIYKSLTGDRAIGKNEVFYAHAAYQPRLVRKKATSSINGQSSMTVMTDGFVEPTRENFSSLIIRNGSETSNRIKEFKDTTKPWLKTESLESDPEQTDDIEAGLTGEPNPSESAHESEITEILF